MSAEFAVGSSMMIAAVGVHDTLNIMGMYSQQ